MRLRCSTDQYVVQIDKRRNMSMYMGTLFNQKYDFLYFWPLTVICFLLISQSFVNIKT